MTYLDADVPFVVAIDPRRKTASIYDQLRNIRTLGDSAEWREPDTFPGFALAISQVFD